MQIHIKWPFEWKILLNGKTEAMNRLQAMRNTQTGEKIGGHTLGGSCKQGQNKKKLRERENKKNVVLHLKITICVFKCCLFVQDPRFT